MSNKTDLKNICSFLKKSNYYKLQKSKKFRLDKILIMKMNIELLKKLKPYIIVLMVAISIVEIVIYSNLCLKKDLQKAKDYFIAGDYSRAAALTVYLMDGDSEYTEEIYLLSADIYLEAQDYNGAKEILEKAIENGYDSEEIIQKNNSIIISNESIPLKLAKDFHPYVEKSIFPFLLILFSTLGLIPIFIIVLKKCDYKKTQSLIEDNIHIDENENATESFIAECNGYVEKQAKKEIEEEYKINQYVDSNGKVDEWFIAGCNKYVQKQERKEYEEEQKKLKEIEFEEKRSKIIKLIPPKTNIEQQAKVTIEETLSQVDNMTNNGWEFEKFCADLLLKNDFIKADVTSGSNDYGVDVVATDEHGVKYAIQCKCYSHTLNNSAVQEVIAGQSMYNCQVAVVMTNQSFTDNAKTLANKNNVLLWDRNKLIEFIEIANKNTKVE